MRRPLGETLGEVLDIFGSRREGPLSIGVQSLLLDLPMEFDLRSGDGAAELLGELPQWRWQTGIEAHRGRLRIRWERVAT